MKNNIATSPNAITIETPWRGCWRVCINGKPASDWSDQASAETHAKRLGWRGNGKPQGTPASLVNERGGRLAANEVAPGVWLGLGPVQQLAL